MQTFVPHKSFIRCALSLDRQRLGKQRVEVLQILKALKGQSKGWVNHPATRMWRGYEDALAHYGRVMCREWVGRGYADTVADKIDALVPPGGKIVLPPWFGSNDVHRSHQSNLLRKNPSHYGPQFPGVPDDLPYIWPVK